MRPCLLCNLLIFFLFLQTSPSTSSTIEDVCGKVAQSYVDHNFCVQALEADPRSRSADIPELAIISMNLSIANATSTESKIMNLLKNASDPTMKNSLEACSYLYTTVQTVLKGARDDIASKNFNAALSEINPAVRIGFSCEGALPASPLTKENDNFSKLALLGKAFINYLIA